MLSSEDQPGCGGQSLPRVERLRRRGEFEAVFRQGVSAHGRLLVLFWLPRPSGSPRKFGVVAGRKVGGAVRRNRAKRLLRDAYRHLRSRLPEDGLHLVLVARRACPEARSGDVRNELEALLIRTGLLQSR